MVEQQYFIGVNVGSASVRTAVFDHVPKPAEI